MEISGFKSDLEKHEHRRIYSNLKTVNMCCALKPKPGCEVSIQS